MNFGLYVCYDLFCLHVEALQMIQPGQPKSGRDRLPHSRHTAVHIYPLLFRTVCGFFNGTLSKDVFERCTSTGSEAFSLFICLDANKLVLLSFFSLLKTIYPRVSTKPLPNDAKSPLPVDVRRSKMLLLKLPNVPHHVSGPRL